MESMMLPMPFQYVLLSFFGIILEFFASIFAGGLSASEASSWVRPLEIRGPCRTA